MKYNAMNKINGIISHYNHKKYWKFKRIVEDPNLKKPTLCKYLYLFRVKRMDAFNSASLGAKINRGAIFEEPPFLPHGIKGVFVTGNARVGKNCTIYQQVTIGIGNSVNEAPIIGDNVLIGAGAKIIGKVKVGNNVKIGANCIVCEDIPDNATVVMNKPRIIIK